MPDYRAPMFQHLPPMNLPAAAYIPLGESAGAV